MTMEGWFTPTGRNPMLAYRLLAKKCRILARHPSTPNMTAVVLIASAKLLQRQAERCVLLAHRLEQLEARAER